MILKKLSKIYTKYIIKSQILFSFFLIIGTAAFLVMTLTLKIDILTRYNGIFADNRIIVNEILDETVESVYAYKSRNDRVYSFPVTQVSYVDDYSVLHIDSVDKINPNNLMGGIGIDIITGRVSLFELIFIKAGQRLEK